MGLLVSEPPGAYAALLLSPEVQRIDFTAEGVAVRGAGYKQVAEALTRGRILVCHNPQRAGAGGATATYNERDNAIFIATPGTATPRQRMILVHELTHAMLDMKRLRLSRGLTVLENEALAYIAGVLYRQLAGGRPWGGNPDGRTGQAEAIAAKIRALPPGSARVSRDDIRRLARAIGEEPMYDKDRDKVYVGGGV